MEMKHFPTINLEATGKHIAQLRKERGLSVKDMQNYFGFDAPQAIYKWQNGTALPTVDNLLALSVLLEVSIDSILVTTPSNITLLTDHEPEGSVFLCKKACRALKEAAYKMKSIFLRRKMLEKSYNVPYNKKDWFQPIQMIFTEVYHEKGSCDRPDPRAGSERGILCCR